MIKSETIEQLIGKQIMKGNFRMTGIFKRFLVIEIPKGTYEICSPVFVGRRVILEEENER